MLTIGTATADILCVSRAPVAHPVEDLVAKAAALPFATMALNHLGRLQESRRQYAAAESALAHSLRLNPAQPDAIQHWVHLRQKQCTWPVYAPPPVFTVNRLMAAPTCALVRPATWLVVSAFSCPLVNAAACVVFSALSCETDSASGPS